MKKTPAREESTRQLVLSRRAFGTSALLAAAGMTAGCGTASSTSGGGAGTAAKTLRIGQSSPPTSLNPALAGFGDLYASLAYGPLIDWTQQNTLQPSLAASWRYIDSDNTAFEVNLRPGVRFTDGTPLTADAVKQNLAYYQSTPGSQAAPFLAAIGSAKPTGTSTLKVSLSQPDPMLPQLFTQVFLAGNMISPAAITHPAKLATGSFGAGQYMLQPSQTISGDHYTYSRNKTYFAPSATAYDQVIVKVLPDENSALDALTTGQVDVISGSYAIAKAAASARLNVAYSSTIVAGLALTDRTGKLCKPLGDQRVRQALNYAVDRATISKALLGGYATPTDQLAAPGQPGYSPGTFYGYDLAKARQLLSAAGYPHGFTLPVVVPQVAAYTDIVEAIGANLQQAGVTLKMTTFGNQSAWAAELPKFPATFLGWGIYSPYVSGRGLWLPGTIFNPFASVDPTLVSLDRQAAAAQGVAAAQLNQQIIQRVRELAWFLPLCFTPYFVFYSPQVAVPSTPGTFISSPTAWHPAQS